MSKKTSSTSSLYTATQIATFINEARTPNEKGVATKRMKAYIAQKVEEDGADPTRVENSIRSMCRRLGRG